jgi:hypothetical protein
MPPILNVNKIKKSKLKHVQTSTLCRRRKPLKRPKLIYTKPNYIHPFQHFNEKYQDDSKTCNIFKPVLCKLNNINTNKSSCIHCGWDNFVCTKLDEQLKIRVGMKKGQGGEEEENDDDDNLKQDKEFIYLTPPNDPTMGYCLPPPPEGGYENLHSTAAMTSSENIESSKQQTKTLLPPINKFTSEYILMRSLDANTWFYGIRCKYPHIITQKNIREPCNIVLACRPHGILISSLDFKNQGPKRDKGEEYDINFNPMLHGKCKCDIYGESDWVHHFSPKRGPTCMRANLEHLKKDENGVDGDDYGDKYIDTCQEGYIKSHNRKAMFASGYNRHTIFELGRLPQTCVKSPCKWSPLLGQENYYWPNNYWDIKLLTCVCDVFSGWLGVQELQTGNKTAGNYTRATEQVKMSALESEAVGTGKGPYPLINADDNWLRSRGLNDIFSASDKVHTKTTVCNACIKIANSMKDADHLIVFYINNGYPAIFHHVPNQHVDASLLKWLSSATFNNYNDDYINKLPNYIVFQEFWHEKSNSFNTLLKNCNYTYYSNHLNCDRDLGSVFDSFISFEEPKCKEETGFRPILTCTELAQKYTRNWWEVGSLNGQIDISSHHVCFTTDAGVVNNDRYSSNVVVSNPFMAKFNSSLTPSRFIGHYYKPISNPGGNGMVARLIKASIDPKRDSYFRYNIDQVLHVPHSNEIQE